MIWSRLMKRLSPARGEREQSGDEDRLVYASLPSREAYVVRVYNDEVTKMEFVVKALEAIFHLKYQQAVQFMLYVHLHGSADVGYMPLARAQEIVAAISELAQRHGEPLRCEAVQSAPSTLPPASVA